MQPRHTLHLLESLLMERLLRKIKSSDIAKRIATGAFWSLTGTAIGKFCVLISGIVCARILGKMTFGEFGMIRSTLGMFIVLGTTGIGVTATRYISQYQKEEKAHAASIYFMSQRFSFLTALCIALAVFLFADTISSALLHEPRLSLSVRFGSLMIFLSILNGMENGVLSGIEAFDKIAQNTFFGSITESILMLVGAYFWGLNGAVLGFGSGILMLYLLNHRSGKKLLHRKGIDLSHRHVIHSDWRLVYRYSVPATISALSVTPAFFAIRAIFVHHESYSALAIYEASDQIKVILLFIPTAVSQIVLPILSSIQNQKTFKKTLNLNTFLIFVITALAAGVTILFSHQLMNLYGSDYKETLPLVLLALSTIFSAVSNVIEMSAYSKDYVWSMCVINLIWAGSMIAFAAFFVGKGAGTTGLSLSVLLSYLLKTIIISIYAKCKI